jgi:hypothetical protein
MVGPCILSTSLLASIDFGIGPTILNRFRVTTMLAKSTLSPLTNGRLGNGGNSKQSSEIVLFRLDFGDQDEVPDMGGGQGLGGHGQELVYEGSRQRCLAFPRITLTSNIKTIMGSGKAD